MKLSLVFLMPDGLHHKVMFVCPSCSGQTFLAATNELTALHCSHCGDVHDASDAEFEVLTAPASAEVPVAKSNVRSYEFTRPPTPRRNP
jgi:hypothetical protein